MRNKLLLLLVVLAIPIAACGVNTPTPEAVSTPAPGAQPTPPGGADQTTVLFAVNEYEMATYNDLIKAFEKDNPGIKIKAISINEILGLGPLDTKWPDDADQKLAAGADVVSMEAGNQSASDKGLIRDLTPFVDADTTFKSDDFIPGALEQFRDDRRAKVERSLERLIGDADPESMEEAAKALGSLPGSSFETQMVRLLLDNDRRVARQAMLAVASRVTRGGFNPLYGPLLVSRLRDRRLKHDARSALVASGPEVIPALVHFMNDPEENPWVRRALPKTVAQIGSPAAVEALLVALEAPDGFLRR